LPRSKPGGEDAVRGAQRLGLVDAAGHEHALVAGRERDRDRRRRPQHVDDDGGLRRTDVRAEECDVDHGQADGIAQAGEPTPER